MLTTMLILTVGVTPRRTTLKLCFAYPAIRWRIYENGGLLVFIGSLSKHHSHQHLVKTLIRYQQHRQQQRKRVASTNAFINTLPHQWNWHCCPVWSISYRWLELDAWHADTAFAHAIYPASS
jgi:hypothetical protein